MPEELERDLGLMSVIAISMGAMIGSGIFILPGIAMSEAGPSVILAFIFAAVLVVPAAISIAELGTAMPEAGGDYIFIERGMGPGAGTIAGLGTWLMLMFKGALALIGGMIYLGPVFSRFGWQVGQLELELIAVTVGAALITVNVIGVKQTGGLQKILVIVMLFIMGGFVALSMGSIEGGHYTEFFSEGSAGFFAATATVLISYGGVTKVAAVAEEIERPGRNLPLGLMLSLVLTAGLYALIVFVIVGVVEEEILLLEENVNIPVVAVVQEIGLGFGAVVAIVIAALFALISTANAGILTASRYPFALSRDNLLPEHFASVNDRFRTPMTAILTTGGAMLAIIVLLPVEDIAKTAGAFQIIVYILVCGALIAFRHRRPVWYDPDFTAPLYPWVQLFGIGSGLFIITQMETLPIIGGVGIVLLGGLWYLVYGRPRVDRTGLVSDAILDTVEPSPEDEDIPHRVVVPVANPETERGLLRMAAASAARAEDAELVAMNVITVPEQTSLAQDVAHEKERIERQEALLEEAEAVATDLDVRIRTRAIVARDVHQAVLKVVNQERAAGIVMGWSGRHRRREHVLGSNIDRILEKAPCEVALVKYGGDEIGDVVALVGDEQNSVVAARQAAAFARSDPAATLTLANVQTLSQDETAAEARERGQTVIDQTAEQAGITEYESRVVVAAEYSETVLEIAAEYDTVCVGASRVSSIERVLSGATPERIGEEIDGTVVLVRGPEPIHRSLRSAVMDRISWYHTPE